MYRPTFFLNVRQQHLEKQRVVFPALTAALKLMCRLDRSKRPTRGCAQAAQRALMVERVYLKGSSMVL